MMADREGVTKKTIAESILMLNYGELIAMAEELERMQADADGFRWRPSKAHGEYGLAQMLHSWAEGIGQD